LVESELELGGAAVVGFLRRQKQFRLDVQVRPGRRGRNGWLAPTTTQEGFKK
jgi:hypothetical protein